MLRVVSKYWDVTDVAWSDESLRLEGTFVPEVATVAIISPALKMVSSGNSVDFSKTLATISIPLASTKL